MTVVLLIESIPQTNPWHLSAGRSRAKEYGGRGERQASLGCSYFVEVSFDAGASHKDMLQTFVLFQV